ncbi:MAG: hypothetical protein QM770_15480 [Tepidisphaeraceae bacterium]
MLAAAEAFVSLTVIALVLVIGSIAVVTWAAVVCLRLVLMLLKLPFRVAGAVLKPARRREPWMDQSPPWPVQSGQRAWAMPSVDVVHVGHVCPNQLCRKTNAASAAFCGRCGASLVATRTNVRRVACVA